MPPNERSHEYFLDMDLLIDFWTIEWQGDFLTVVFSERNKRFYVHALIDEGLDGTVDRELKLDWPEELAINELSSIFGVSNNKEACWYMLEPKTSRVFRIGTKNGLPTGEHTEFANLTILPQIKGASAIFVYDDPHRVVLESQWSGCCVQGAGDWTIELADRDADGVADYASVLDVKKED